MGLLTQQWIVALSSLSSFVVGYTHTHTDEPVYIQGGRETADPINGVVRSNFFSSPTRQLASSTWFVREELKNKEYVKSPLSAHDAAIVEHLYQRVVAAAASLGGGVVDGILKEDGVDLKDDHDYKVVVAKKEGCLVMKKRAKNWLFGGSFELQRGYGPYTVDGELEETSLGPVTHLVFLVHGIGEALWSRQDNSVLSTIEDLNRTRTNLYKKQYTDWRKACDRAKRNGYVTIVSCLVCVCVLGLFFYVCMY